MGSVLQPGAFSLGTLGSSYWNSKSLEEPRAAPLPSTEQRMLCSVVRGWVAAAAEVRGAGGCWIAAALCVCG